MAENSKIEWTDHTFNPAVGCTKVSPACDFCYAENWAKRTGQPELWNGERRRTSAANWRKPLKWDDQARAEGIRRRVFCASLADVFDNQWEEEWRDDLWRLIDLTPNLDWLLLTKRPQNIAKMLPEHWEDDGLHNVWLGTTAENQDYFDARWKHLSAIPARVHFISYEPALGPLTLPDNPPDWNICGGESGGHARMMNPEWAYYLRAQCRTAGVPFFMKQMTKKAPIPDGLMVRQFPSLASRSERQSRHIPSPNPPKAESP
jgi:protein gp37